MASNVMLKAQYPETKLEVLRRNLGLLPREYRRMWVDLTQHRLRERRRKGPMWRYRNRQIMRQIDWDMEWWRVKVRRTL